RDGAVSHAKSGSDLLEVHPLFAAIFSPANLIDGELAHAVPVSAIVCPVPEFVSMVLGPRRPAEVGRSVVCRIAIVVSNLVQRAWSGAVECLSNQSVNLSRV